MAPRLNPLNYEYSGLASAVRGETLFSLEAAAQARPRYRAPIPVWEVGPYPSIRGRLPGHDAHHVGQKVGMKRFVGDAYDERLAPAILVPKVGHTIEGPRGVVSRSLNGITSGRGLVARDIRELRRIYPEVPNSSLRQLIQDNKQLYMEAIRK